MKDLCTNRAHCIQMMHEVAAAIREFHCYRMRIRFHNLVNYAVAMDWLPDCYEIPDDLLLRP